MILETSVCLSVLNARRIPVEYELETIFYRVSSAVGVET